jgi:hypothetical protein
MAFMTPEVVGKQEWIGVETSAGFWWVPIDVLSSSEIASARRGDFEPLLKYTEGNKVYNDQSMIKKGYGVRLSARGYMDSTDWEVYGSKAEALKRARELAREAEGEDYATKKKTPTRHATKKSPAQLQREIDETLAHSNLTPAQREHIALFEQDVREHPGAYKAMVRDDPAGWALRTIEGLDDADVREFTRDLRAERKKVARLTGHSTKRRRSQGKHR